MMKRYQHSKKKSDRGGFYVALTICLVAVGLAVWSAYTSIGNYLDDSEESDFSSLVIATEAEAVAQDMTGVFEDMTEAVEPTTIATGSAATGSAATETEASTEPPTEEETRRRSLTIYETYTLPKTEDVAAESDLDSLQAVLKVADSLIYPTKSHSVLKQYSEDAVYNQTMKDYRVHTGCDFDAETGESVYAMCSGTVSDIAMSEFYGIIVAVDSDDFTVYYCGLDPDLSVEKGDEVTTADTIGTVSQIPCESADEPHIHIEIRVDGKLIDPLSVINSDD